MLTGTVLINELVDELNELKLSTMAATLMICITNPDFWKWIGLRYNKHCQSVRGSRLIPLPSFSPCTHNAWRGAASIPFVPLPNSSIYCVPSS